MKSHVFSATRLLRGAMCVVILLTLPYAILAQLSERVTEICEVVHPIGWVKFKEGVNVAGDRVFLDYAENFGLGENDEMRLIRHWTDDLGFTHYRYQQFHAGVPIEYAMFTIQSRNGRSVSGNGRIAAYFQPLRNVVVSKQQALHNAILSLPYGTPSWLDDAAEKFLQSVRGDTTISYFRVPELLYARRNVEGPYINDNLVLTYRVQLPTIKPVDDFQMYINAADGQTVRTQRRNTGCTGSTATVRTLYNDTQTVHVTSTGSDYNLETSCSYGVSPNTLVTQIRTREIDDFLVYEPTQNDVVHSDLDWTDDADLDPFAQAHWGTMMTYEYFRTTHDYAAYGGIGATMLTLVGGLDFPNWYSDYLAIALPTFNDVRFEEHLTNWPVSLDVIGHEWTHAITYMLTNLSGDPTGEFGALYESFGDIFGSLVECYAKAAYDANNPIDCEDFTIGEECLTAAYQRDMVSPHQKSHPDTYCGTYWDENIDSFHGRGGVQNRWFTLLAKQKDVQNSPWTGENNHCCSPETYSVTPIGKEKAALIAFRNLRKNLLPHSNYVDAMLGSLAAADHFIDQNHHDFTSADREQIVAAWKAVGVYENRVGYHFVRCSTEYSSTSDETELQAVNMIRAESCYGEGVLVKAGANLAYTAGQEVRLKAGFVAEQGCEFTARIAEPCTTFFAKSVNPSHSASFESKQARHSSSNLVGDPVIIIAPNPVLATGSIWFSVDNPSVVSVTLFDSMGRVAAILLDKVHYGQGAHKMLVSFAGVAAGAYLCLLEAGGQVVTTMVQVMP